MSRPKGSKNNCNEEVIEENNDSSNNNIKVKGDNKAEKLNAVKMAMSQIEKDYGKGSVMMLGKSPTVKTEFISTGATSLDIALGVGGLPKGRIIEILGPEAGGKCLVKDTYILTPNGYQTIEEIFEDNNFKPFCVNKTKKVKIPLINRYGKEENTITLVQNGKRKIKKIKTKSGNEIKSTYLHPHLVISNNGNLVWRKTEELKDTDYIATFRNECFFGNNEIDKSESYLLGVLIADGCFQDNRLLVTNDDPYIKDLIENKFAFMFGFNEYKKYAKQDNNTGSFDYHFNSKEICKNFYNKYKLSTGIAKDKIIPNVIFRSNKETIKSFIKGYVDCECSVDNEGIEICSASHKLLMGLKLLLLQFGIICFINKKIVKSYEQNDYWRLMITGLSFKKYIDEIGFDSNVRKEQLKKVLKNNKKVHTNVDSIPNVNNILNDLYNSFETDRKINKIFGDYMGGGQDCNLTYDRLNKIIEVSPKDNDIVKHLKDLKELNYFYDKIDSIEDCGEEPVYDFEMENTHSFIANGMVTHNTTLALSVVSNCQKNGGIAAYVDVENAIDLNYCKNIGIDVDSLIFSQPDFGEQALDIVETLVRSGGVDLIVVDSVSALVPKAEIEGEMADQNMGLQARLMSKAMRKLTAITSKSKTTIIFINQIREKIGVMFGSNETSSGGRALKFFASVRMDVRRVEAIKKGEEIIGNRVKIKMVKNKVAPPFREAIIEIIFGKGINEMSSLLDSAVNFNVIEKSGTWFSYNGEKIGQGKDQTIDYLEKNISIAEEIKNKTMEKAMSKMEIKEEEKENEKNDNELVSEIKVEENN
jgi:recombination protein RecA